jgi:Carboxypeptidase regulatory-like domain
MSTMSTRSIRQGGGAICSFVLLLGFALAQTNVGAITGNVTDAAGAPIANCRVTATNVQTGLKQSVNTDSEGNFVFASLPAGTWNLRAEQNGFRPAERTGVALDAASRRTIGFALEVGAVTETLSVSAAGDQVQAASGDISRTITGTQVSQIPLNGRNYAQLLSLLPGAVSTSTNPFGLGLSTTGTRMNGIRSNSIYFNVDGADNMDNGGNSNAIVNPSLDTIAEIKVLTSSYSAEFGGRSGALVNVVTKSGGRAFHGTLFEYVRNDVFDARSFFAARKEPLRFNNFGWTFGGPVFIPRKFNAERSRLFFFAGQEWKYNRQGATRLSTVPTAAERAGDFRQSTLAAPIDPVTRTAFPDRIVPAARFSRNGAALLRPYPLPNFAGPGGNYTRTAVSRTDTRGDHVRVDYLASERTQVMGRYTHDEWDIFDGFQGGSLGIVPGGRPRPGWTAILSLTHTFSPTLSNSASVSATANQIQGLPQNSGLTRAALGLTYPELFPVNSYGVGPNVNIAGFTGYNVGDRIRNLNSTIQFRDDLSRVAGAHTLKFGVQYTRSRKDQNSIATDNGNLTFNTSAAGSTRNVIADVLLGVFQNYTEGQVDTAYFARFNQLEFYAQDNWRVNRKLSVELGLRYNLIAPLYSALGNFTTFLPERFDRAKAPQVAASNGALTFTPQSDPYNGIVIFGQGFPQAARGRIPEADNAALQRLFAGLPRGGVETNYRLFGPRLGFAYDPFGGGKMAVRGGFGIFYDRIRTDFLGGTAGNPPFSNSANIFDGNIENPSGGATRRFAQNINAISLDPAVPSVMTFNLGVQQEVFGNLILDTGYVGTLGRHLTRTRNLNQLAVGARFRPENRNVNVNALRPYPGYANINVQENGDNSNYHSLQASLNRRMQKGLAFGVNYTFSRTLETSGGGFQDVYDEAQEIGLSGIHRAHVLNFNYVYEIPFFRNHGNAFVRNVLGGWDVSGITIYQSGAPNTITINRDSAGIGAGSVRADLTGRPDLARGDRTLARWFNTAAFAAPPDGRFGSSGRNILIGPGFSQWDASLLKNIYFTETVKLQFRAEAFNIWNHASFTGLSTNLSSPNFGQVTGSGPGRILEFGLRLAF